MYSVLISVGNKIRENFLLEQSIAHSWSKYSSDKPQEDTDSPVKFVISILTFLKIKPFEESEEDWQKHTIILKLSWAYQNHTAKWLISRGSFWITEKWK